MDEICEQLNGYVHDPQFFTARYVGRLAQATGQKPDIVAKFAVAFFLVLTFVHPNAHFIVNVLIVATIVLLTYIYRSERPNRDHLLVLWLCFSVLSLFDRVLENLPLYYPAKVGVLLLLFLRPVRAVSPIKSRLFALRVSGESDVCDISAADWPPNFLRDYLGPSLANSKVTNTLQIMGLDDGRIMLPGWADTVSESIIKTKKCTVIHWQSISFIGSASTGTETFTHRRFSSTRPTTATRTSSSCGGLRRLCLPPETVSGRLVQGGQYAESIINNLNHWVADWNLVLDLTGGPNWVGNVVDAPILVNKTADEFYKQPMFYAMGHFSKFLCPGARRIAHKMCEGYAGLYAVATSRNAQRSLVILNSSSNFVEDLYILESTFPERAVSVSIPPHSITTVIWNKSGRRQKYSSSG